MSDHRNDIERYVRGEMTPAEMHALEKKALSDPFLADALEGASSIGKDHFIEDVDELNRSIHKKKEVIFTPLRIAAGIIVVIGVSLFVVLNPAGEQDQLAQKIQNESPKESENDAAATTADSTKAGLTEQATAKQDQQLTLAEERKSKKFALKKTEPEAKDAEHYAFKTAPDSVVVETQPASAPIIIAKEEQKKVVSGTVTSAEDGLPLPGVTIIVKGSQEGTITDTNGNYSIEVADSAALRFSFIGMHTNEVLAKASKLDVKMKEDVSQLSEVLITRSPMPKDDNAMPVVKLAEPVGGLRAYDKYLEDNKRYPQQALDNDVKGRVIVGFDVGINGDLDNFVVIRSLGYGCDDEIIRLVKEGPQWKPTTEDGKAVESTVHVKMKFDARKFKARKKK